MKSLWDSSNVRILLYGIIALLITAGSLLYANHLSRKLLKEEEKRMELFAAAQEFLGDETANEEGRGIEFVFKNLTKPNDQIPTLMANEQDSILSAMNMDFSPGTSPEDSIRMVRDLFQSLKSKGSTKRIEVDFYGEKILIYYDESPLLKQLRWFPYLQLLVILVFISVVFGSFFIAKRSEQNKVWVGLAKETAHQLGTPVSSLMAWVELLSLKMDSEADRELLVELEKDVERLKTIAERFSKIGSKPELHTIPFREVIETATDYIRKRMSKRVTLEVQNHISESGKIAVNRALFDWVIENLLKNALDAIPGEGKISITGSESQHEYYIDVSDTGKGIPRGQFRQVFKAGFTTKKRGWGLGLSLTKRIVENYHKGKIFVKQSEVGKGTTFRVILPKSRD